MRLIQVISVALLGLASASGAWAADPRPAENPGLNAGGDSRAILPLTTTMTEWNPLSGKDDDRVCYRMRTYRIRKDLDRESVIRVRPDDATFDPDNVIGYSTCQRAGKYGVRSTE